MIEIIRNTGRFIILVLLQVVVLNNIDISAFLSPMVIVLFIISLPFNTPKWVLLLSAFLLGLSIDLFMNTPGILSFTSVLIAYIRPLALQVLQPREGYFIGSAPRVPDLGWGWFFQFSMVLTLLFHFVYFVILGFGQDNFLVTIWKTIISSAFTLAIIFIFQLFSIKK